MRKQYNLAIGLVFVMMLVSIFGSIPADSTTSAAPALLDPVLAPDGSSFAPESVVPDLASLFANKIKVTTDLQAPEQTTPKPPEEELNVTQVEVARIDFDVIYAALGNEAVDSAATPPPQPKVVPKTNTAPPASASPKTVTASPSAQACEMYRPLVAQYTDWNVNLVLQLMFVESKCDPAAENLRDKHSTCRGSFGLMQIGCLHVDDASALHDPATNIAVAHTLWLGRPNYHDWINSLRKLGLA